jgi:hypothetical protein
MVFASTSCRTKIKRVIASYRGGAAAGAHATYEVAGPADDATMEQVWLLVRPTSGGVQAVYHTTRFRTADINHIQWAHLRTLIIDQYHWDPSAPRQSAPDLWPESVIARASAKLHLTDAGWSEAVAKSKDIGPLTDEHTNVLVDIFREVAMTDEPPKTPVVGILTELIERRIAACAPSRAAEALLRNLVLCATVMDLRAWSWQCVWAIGNREDRGPDQRPKRPASPLTMRLERHAVEGLAIVIEDGRRIVVPGVRIQSFYEFGQNWSGDRAMWSEVSLHAHEDTIIIRVVDVHDHEGGTARTIAALLRSDGDAWITLPPDTALTLAAPVAVLSTHP